MMLLTLSLLMGLNFIEFTHSKIEDPDIRAKIEWNIYLNQIYDSQISKHSGRSLIVESQNVTKRQLQQVDEVLDLTNEPLDITCIDNKTLIIKRTVIKISDLVNTSMTCNDIQPALIEIFAADSIIIDEDLNLSGYYGLLSIFAPKWEVQGKRVINLDGAPPSDIDPPTAANGTSAGSAGYDGQPGNPGNPGGSFFGLGGTFKNPANLEVSARGGDGGTGQNGGAGINGRDGRNGNVKDELYSCSKSWFTWTCKGEEGQPGGNGGDGGIGGYPGSPGNVLIISLDNSSQSIVVTVENGTQGIDGVGGPGAGGGKKGDTYKGVHVIWWFNIHKSETVTTRAAAGSGGENGTNEKNVAYPKAPIDVVSKVEDMVNDYKDYIEDSLEIDFLRDEEYRFLVELMNEPQMEVFYTTKGVIREFTSLEEHYDKLHNEVDFFALYEPLLDHIVAIPVPDDETKKVLAYVYTTTLSKICALQEQTNRNFITDLKTFLDVCIDNINELKEAKTAVTIGEYGSVYKNDIDDEITEANHLITQQIIPKITQTTAKIDDSIKQLSEEIFELQREAEVEQLKLEAARRRMRTNIIGKLVGGIMGGVGSVLSFFGPWGAVAGNVIGKVSQVTQFGFGSSGAIDRTIDGFVDLKDQYLGIVNAAELKTQKVIAEFRNQIQELQTLAETTAISADLNQIDADLKAWKGNEAGVIDMYTKAMEAILAKAQTGRGLGGSFKEAVQNIIKKAIPIIKTSIDIYKTYKSDQNKIDTLSAEIEANKQTIQLFKDYEQRIQDTLIPMMEEVGNTLKYIEAHLNDSSAAQLEVTKWEVQETLTNVKQMLQDFTKGFDVQSVLGNCVDVITDAVNTMINIYDKIQNFRNQKKLADYIANVNTAACSNIAVQDPELQQSINKLDLYIQSNIILQKYRESITQIKQLAFPLAENYFTQMSLPQGLQMEDNFETYTHNAIYQLERFQQKIYDASIYISKFDDIKHRADFYDQSTAGPFMTWPYLTHSETTLQLLTGQEAVFYANPNHHWKNAIKFNIIGLYFKVVDHQEKLNELLTNFEAVLTHTGNSYYNCNNKTYAVTTGSQTFQFDFKKGKNDPGDVNLVFEKIHTGDFLLSPFTTWKMQLVDKTGDGYDQLTVYGMGAELQLVGQGEFFESDKELCSQNLEKYYKVEDVSKMKEAKCVEVLSGGLFDRDEACLAEFY